MNKNLMKFSITNDNFKKYPNSCIVTGIFEDSIFFPSTLKINQISQGYIHSLLERNMFNGLLGQKLLLYDAPYFLNRQILLLGGGKKNEFNKNNYRHMISEMIEFCKQNSISKILLLFSEFSISEYDDYWKIRDSISLLNTALYTFNKFKSKLFELDNILYDISLYISDSKSIKLYNQAVVEGLNIADGVNIAKNLSNMPPNYCTPSYLTKKSKELTNHYHNIQTEILNETEIEALGMNAYLAVGKSSMYPAVMPIIKYLNHPHGPNYNPIVLVGKGLTFDSGGISIKPADKMDEMKYDMCGAAVVYAIMCIASKLNLPLNIIGVLAISENMINNESLRPGDIIKTLSGQTVEVLNTDAEGRLVLCDVLTYINRFNPEVVIDIATLTGACVIALGHHFSGLMSNNKDLSDSLIIAGLQTQDYVWKLPLDKVFEKQLKSSFADMTNIGGKSGNVITAACFLKKFVTYNWAHLDIAGTAWHSSDTDKSSTGRPVELLSQFLLNIIKHKTKFSFSH